MTGTVWLRPSALGRILNRPRQRIAQWCHTTFLVELGFVVYRKGHGNGQPHQWLIGVNPSHEVYREASELWPR